MPRGNVHVLIKNAYLHYNQFRFIILTKQQHFNINEQSNGKSVKVICLGIKIKPKNNLFLCPQNTYTVIISITLFYIFNNKLEILNIGFT